MGSEVIRKVVQPQTSLTPVQQVGGGGGGGGGRTVSLMWGRATGLRM